MKLHTLSMTVEDYAGVLTRVSSLFGRRGYNIHSLTVGETEREGVSRMTVRVACEDHLLTQIVRQLQKVPCVYAVSVLEPDGCVSRELMLVKVCARPGQRGEIMEVAGVFRANVLDVARQSMTLELTGDTEKTNALLDVLEPYGILECARTGVASLARREGTIYDHQLDDEGHFETENRKEAI